MPRSEPGAGTLRGLFARSLGGLPFFVAGEPGSGLIDTLRCGLRKRRLRGQARERSSGEILNKARVRQPLKEKTPREQPAAALLNTGVVARHSREEQSPETGGAVVSLRASVVA